MRWYSLFIYLPFLAGLLIILGLVFPSCRQLRLKTRVQTVWALAILFCCSKFLCFRMFGGHAYTPDLPAAVIWTWDWLYSGAIILSMLALLTLFFHFRAKLWVLPILAWGVAARGIYNGLRVPRVREVELSFADLPKSLDGYRIAHLSDLHCSSAARRWRTAAVVDAVNALEPDLICLTGDFSDGCVDKIGPFLEPLRELDARDGVYACTGNHEYYHDYRSWTRKFYAHVPNIRFLTNQCAFPRQGLALAGVPDLSGLEHNLDVVPNSRKAFAQAKEGDFRILLQHRPKGAVQNCRKVGVRLQLSGHTHGGIAPFIRSLVAKYNGGYSRGLYPLGRSYLYVSPGCGQWGGFPMRVFNDSEITLLTLRQKEVNKRQTQNAVCAILPEG